MNNTILVLGGFGFIGSKIVKELVAHHYDVTIFEHPKASDQRVDKIKQQVKVIRGDYCKPDEVISALQGVDTAISLVHSSVPASSMEFPCRDVIDNVAGSVGWLSRLNETSLKKIIYFSSGGTVYGEKKGVISEDALTDPICSYGITKLAIEKYIKLYCDLYKISYIITRPSNIYGEFPDLNRPQGVIGFMIMNCLQNLPVQVIGNGENIRDYVYINDVVNAVIKLMEYQGNERIFNIGSEKGVTILEIIHLLKPYFPELKVEYTLPRFFDVFSNVLDISKIKKVVGWKPEINLETGIKKTIHSILSNRN